MDTTQEFAALPAGTYVTGLAAMPVSFTRSPLPDAANDATGEAACLRPVSRIPSYPRRENVTSSAHLFPACRLQ
jgi:hypothetical protein